MRFLKAHGGHLVVPSLALAYGLFALWEMTSGGFQEVTIIYTFVIALPMLALGALALAGDLRTRTDQIEPTEEEAFEEQTGGAVEPMAEGGMRRLVLVVGASFLLVLVLPWIGYHIGFFVYVIFVLWAVDMRRPGVMLTIGVIMTAVVHFVFAGLLSQDLPLGVLSGLLGE
jgi:hypothetical protein